MIELITGSWDACMHIVQTSPAALWPLLLALVGSVALTQVVKKLVIPAEWSDLAKARVSQIVAVLTAVGTVAYLMPTPTVLVSGFVTGLSSPTVYFFGVRLIGLKWPVAREWLSNS